MRLLRLLGVAALAAIGYKLWRRRAIAPDTATAAATPAPSPWPERTVHVEPAEPEPVRADDLTSPGTVSDPDLERRRAEEALARELESRASEETKFEELRREQEVERQEAAAVLDEPPPPLDESAPPS